MDFRKCHLPENRVMLNLLLSTSYLLWIIPKRDFTKNIKFDNLESQWAPGRYLAKWASVIHHERGF